MRQPKLEAVVTGVMAMALLASCAHAPVAPGCESVAVRIAIVDAGLVGRDDGEITRRLSTDLDPQARAVARILQRVRPDVALLLGFDWDSDARAARRFQERYLGIPQQGEPPLEYPHRLALPVNRGEPSGLDLDGDGRVGGPGDAWSWGRYPGQGGMLLLSRLPFADPIRTFRTVPSEWPERTPAEGAIVAPDHGMAPRLSATSIWDVPIETPEGTLRVLASDTLPLAEALVTRASIEQVLAQSAFLDAHARGLIGAAVVDDQGRRLTSSAWPDVLVAGRGIDQPPRPSAVALDRSSEGGNRREHAEPETLRGLEASEGLGIRLYGGWVVCARGEIVEPANKLDGPQADANPPTPPSTLLWLDLARSNSGAAPGSRGPCTHEPRSGDVETKWPAMGRAIRSISAMSASVRDAARSRRSSARPRVPGCCRGSRRSRPAAARGLLLR
jgi:hypothetical protein